MDSISDEDLICIRWTQPTVLEQSLYIAPTAKRHFDLEMAWAKFERVLSSKQGFELDSDFSLSVFSLKRSRENTTSFPIASTPHLLESTAGGDGEPTSSSYLSLNAHQRSQLSTIDFRPLRHRASELISRCKSIIDVRDGLFSVRMMRMERMPRSYRQKLFMACEKEAKARSHKKPRTVARKGSAFDADLVKYLPVRHLLQYIGKDCVPRSLAVGVTHAIVFARAQQLLEGLEAAVEIGNTPNLLAAIKEAEIFGGILPKGKLSALSCGPGSVSFEKFMAHAAKNMHIVAKEVFNTILGSEAFDLACESLARYNPPIGDRYLVKQLNPLSASISQKMRKALEKGYSKIDLAKPWPFVVPGMTAKTVKVSIYTFDGTRIDGVSHIVSPYSTVHVRVLQSWSHMWVLTDGVKQLRDKCPSAVKRCEMCNAVVNKGSLLPHACPMACSMCRRVSCTGKDNNIILKQSPESPLVECVDCRRLFLKGACYLAHKERIDWSSPATLCDLLQICIKCGRQADYSNKVNFHACGKTNCPICGIQYARYTEHKCYLQPVSKTLSPLLRKSTPLAFDCETVVDTATSIMMPVLIIVGEYRNDVFNIVAKFVGYDCFDKMAAWLVSSVEHRILIAHNGSRFDALFLADALFRVGVETHVIIGGSGALLQLTITPLDVQVIDSCRLSPSTLNQFFLSYVPKGTRDKLDLAGKEFFPYALLTKSNYDAHYITQPTLSDFQPGEMRSKTQKNGLIEHYNATIRERLDADGHSPTYNLHEELLSYCESDVRLLAMGVHYFRQACLNFGFDTDPLTEATTVASLALRVWRKQFLTKDTVAIFTENGGKLSSYVADQYLNWIKESEASDLQFKYACGTEKKVYASSSQCNPLWLDGYSTVHKLAYEFLGCFWHGCPICYPNNRDAMVPMLGMSFSEAYEAVAIRQYTILRDNASSIKDFAIMWEHQWNAMVRNPANAELAKFIKRYEDDYPPPIVERDALFGGKAQINSGNIANILACPFSKQGEPRFFVQRSNFAKGIAPIALNVSACTQTSQSTIWT